jgi:hypothetical protein
MDLIDRAHVKVAEVGWAGPENFFFDEIEKKHGLVDVTFFLCHTSTKLKKKKKILC